MKLVSIVGARPRFVKCAFSGRYCYPRCADTNYPCLKSELSMPINDLKYYSTRKTIVIIRNQISTTGQLRDSYYDKNNGSCV